MDIISISKRRMPKAMKKKNPTTYGTESELAKWLDHMIEPENTEAIFENCFATFSAPRLAQH